MRPLTADGGWSCLDGWRAGGWPCEDRWRLQLLAGVCAHNAHSIMIFSNSLWMRIRHVAREGVVYEQKLNLFWRALTDRTCAACTLHVYGQSMRQGANNSLPAVSSLIDPANAGPAGVWGGAYGPYGSGDPTIGPIVVCISVDMCAPPVRGRSLVREVSNLPCCATPQYMLDVLKKNMFWGYLFYLDRDPLWFLNLPLVLIFLERAC